MVGQTTARRVDETFELEQLGELELKGKEQARQRVPRRGRPRGTSRTPGAPLVGRKEELAALTGPSEGSSRERARSSRSPASRESQIAPHRRAGDAVRRARPLPRGSRRLLCRDDPLLAGARAAPQLARSGRLRFRGPRPARATDGACARSPTRQTRPIPSSQASSASCSSRRRSSESAISHATRSTRDVPLALPARLHTRARTTAVPGARGSPLVGRGDAFVARRAAPAAQQTPVAFLLVHRSDPDHPAWQLVDRARRRFEALFVELELEPLPSADARALAEPTLGASCPSSWRSSSASGRAATPTSSARRSAICGARRAGA